VPWLRAECCKCLPFVELDGKIHSETDVIYDTIGENAKIIDVGQAAVNAKDIYDSITKLLWCANLLGDIQSRHFYHVYPRRISNYFRYKPENCQKLFSEAISGALSATVPVVPHSRHILVSIFKIIHLIPV